MNLSKTVLTRIGILLPLFVLIFFSNASTQSLGTWAFNGNTTGVAGSYNTVSNADFSPSITNKGYSGSVYYGETNWPPGAINTSQYFQFSLTPAAGNALNLLSVVMSMRRSSTGSPVGSGPQSFSIRSSIDNFTLDLLTGSLSSNVANYSIFPVGFNLMASIVTFRVYGFNSATTSGGSNRLVFDNISVAGSNIILAANQPVISAKNQRGRIDVSVAVNDIFAANSYMIERSSDGVHFTPLNNVDIAKAVNNKYIYSDIQNNYAGKLYYRLHVENENGTDSYSNIAVVTIEQPTNQFKMFVRGNSLNFLSDITGPCIFTLLSASGASVYTSKLYHTAATNTIVLPRVVPGIYYGSLVSGKVKQTTAIRLGNTF